MRLVLLKHLFRGSGSRPTGPFRPPGFEAGFLDRCPSAWARWRARVAALLLMAATLVAGAQGGLAAEALDNWEQMAPRQFTLLFSGLAWGDGLFVAVGANGLLATSPDGFTWTARDHGQNTEYRSVAHSQGKFVAVGKNGPTLESVDGTGWSPAPDGATYDLYGVAAGNGVFVAVGFLGRIYSSADGRTWTARASGASSRLHSVTFGNGLFVATGLSGTILTSPDGATWTPRSSQTANALFASAFGSGTFAAVGAKSTLVTSTNGVDWVDRSWSGADLQGIAWGQGTFVAVGYGSVSANGALLWTSPDAIQWTRRDSHVTSSLRAVAFGAGRFVAVGESGTIVRSGLLGAAETGVTLQRPRRNGDALEFSFNTQPGRGYEVQVSTNLVDWTKTRAVLAESALTGFSELSHGAPRRYYRVLSQPQ